MGFAIGASAILGAVMTLGDVTWAQFGIRHRVAYGIVHGAVMCFCLGLAIGVRARRPAPAAAGGPVIGVLAALTFYVLAPALRWSAMFPAWMLLWILFALLQQWLDRREPMSRALVRGVAAAILSGVAFYLVSGIWTSEHGAPNVLRHFLSWSFAFLPGFLALFLARPRS